MDDPYEVLGLPADADEADVRRRYLELVRQFPPEQEPLRCAEIRAAYDKLRDPVTRLKHWLFQPHGDDSFERLLADVRNDLRQQRIAPEILLSLAEK